MNSIHTHLRAIHVQCEKRRSTYAKSYSLGVPILQAHYAITFLLTHATCWCCVKCSKDTDIVLHSSRDGVYLNGKRKLAAKNVRMIPLSSRENLRRPINILFVSLFSNCKISAVARGAPKGYFKKSKL